MKRRVCSGLLGLQGSIRHPLCIVSYHFYLHPHWGHIVNHQLCVLNKLCHGLLSDEAFSIRFTSRSVVSIHHGSSYIVYVLIILMYNVVWGLSHICSGASNIGCSIMDSLQNLVSSSPALIKTWAESWGPSESGRSPVSGRFHTQFQHKNQNLGCQNSSKFKIYINLFKYLESCFQVIEISLVFSFVIPTTNMIFLLGNHSQWTTP